MPATVLPTNKGKRNTKYTPSLPKQHAKLTLKNRDPDLLSGQTLFLLPSAVQTKAGRPASSSATVVTRLEGLFPPNQVSKSGVSNKGLRGALSRERWGGGERF